MKALAREQFEETLPEALQDMKASLSESVALELDNAVVNARY